MSEKAMGTALPVATDARTWPVVVIGMDSEARPRDGKMSPDGRQTYASGCILMVDRGGDLRADKSASVHVVEPATYALGQRYVAQGRVWVQPYENNQRVALSITVERLVPHKSAAGGES